MAGLAANMEIGISTFSRGHAGPRNRKGHQPCRAAAQCGRRDRIGRSGRSGCLWNRGASSS